MHRRTFLKNGLLSAGALMTGSFVLSACKSESTQSIMVPGVQIYSVRNELQADLEGTLRELYRIGYRDIEGYGLTKQGKILGYDLDEFLKILENTGLEMPSCHCEYFTQAEANDMLAYSEQLGLEFLVIPYLDEQQRDDYESVAENLNSIGDLFTGSTAKLGYHNHDFEFQPQSDGSIPMEILIEQTDAGKVWFEADIYWIRKAGKDPLTWLNKYPDRFRLFHVKDANEQLDQTTVGEGIIDFESILDTFDERRIDYAFIEDERTGTPIKNLEAAFKHITKMG